MTLAIKPVFTDPSDFLFLSTTFAKGLDLLHFLLLAKIITPNVLNSFLEGLYTPRTVYYKRSADFYEPTKPNTEEIEAMYMVSLFSLYLNVNLALLQLCQNIISLK